MRRRTTQTLAGDEFYALFKDALDALDVPWGDMAQMTVVIKGSTLTFSHGGRTFSVVEVRSRRSAADARQD